MDIRLAKFLVQATQGSESEFSLVEDYSGRGMYGATTAAISVPDVLALSTAMYYLSSEIAQGIENGELPAETGTLRWDNLGRDIVVY
uniref:Uncharacterized protein n=1 Tax=Pseudomonas phage Cygsa01 TaxID=3138529 RepID=A0AAU6W3K5_9VIRU